MTNYHCDRCDGYGSLPDPSRRRWQFWQQITCPVCGGDGRAKIPTPPLPPPPPPPQRESSLDILIRIERELERHRAFLDRWDRKEYSHPLPPADDDPHPQPDLDMGTEWIGDAP
jgi:hypothetical protein